MPKEKKIFLHVPTLYKRQALDHILFGYISGIRKAMPATSIKECVCYFMEDNNLSEDEYPMETACQTYFRMQKEYYQSKRSKYD